MLSVRPAVSSILPKYLYILLHHPCVFFPFSLDALVPVTLVRLGEPVTFTCVLPKELARRQIHWYKQSPGENLSMVVTFINLVKPLYGAEFSASRLQIKQDEGGCNLTILETISGDEGMYHCALIDYFSIRWSASYLLIEGKNDFFLSLHVCFGHFLEGCG